MILNHRIAREHANQTREETSEPRVRIRVAVSISDILGGGESRQHDDKDNQERSQLLQHLPTTQKHNPTLLDGEIDSEHKIDAPSQ